MMLTVATVGVYTPAMPPNDAMDVVFVDVKGVAHIGRRDNCGTWIAMGVGDDDWAQKYFDHDEVAYWFALPKVEVLRAAK